MLRVRFEGDHVAFEPPPAPSLRKKLKELDGYLEGRTARVPRHRLLDIEDLLLQVGIERDSQYADEWFQVYFGVSEQEQEERANLLNQSDPTHDPREIQTPLYPYQRRAVQMLQRAGRGILADEPGLGKTLQGLSWAFHWPGPTLICCPASITHVWEDEIAAKTSADHATIRGRASKAIPSTRFVIVPYSVLRDHTPALQAHGFTSAIFDEVHHLKNPTSQQGKAGARLAKSIPQILMMSGTLMVCEAVDLYPVVHAVRPRDFPSRRAFKQRYCRIEKAYYRGRRVDRVVSSRRLDELRRRMDPWMVSRELTNVRQELPAKRVSVNTVDPGPAEIAAYRRALDDMRSAVRSGKPASQAAADLERITNQAKVEAARQFLDDFQLLADRKIIVFSQHLDPILDLRSKDWLDISIEITGSVPISKRRAMIKSFQTDPRIRAAFCQLQAGGEGTTMDAADTVLIIDGGWTAARVEQAIARARRINTESALHVVHLISTLPLDQKRWNRLSGRLKSLEKAHGRQASDEPEELRRQVFLELLNEPFDTSAFEGHAPQR